MNESMVYLRFSNFFFDSLCTRVLSLLLFDLIKTYELDRQMDRYIYRFARFSHSLKYIYIINIRPNRVSTLDLSNHAKDKKDHPRSLSEFLSQGMARGETAHKILRL